MFYFNLITAVITLVSTSVYADNQIPTQTEIEALQSTHSQFEGLQLDGVSAYEASKHYLDGLSIPSTESKYPATVTFSKEDAKLFREGYKKSKQLGLEQEDDKPDWIRDVEVKSWDKVVTKIGVDGESAVKNRIQKAYPNTKGQDLEVVRGNDGSSTLLNTDEDLYYFITSGMKDVEIVDILLSSKKSGATVVMRGMIPGTTAVTDTSRYLLKLITKANLTSSPPKIIIDPRLFNVFSISKAPAMAYVKGSIEVTAHGASSPEWFLETARKETQFKELGEIAATTEIIEEDLLALLERKHKEIDWKKQRKQAVSNYFARQTFKIFPVSSEDRNYELDPRIIFTKDVFSGGKLMAKKGDVVNPLAGFEGVNRSLFIIDPRDPRQRSLVKDRLYKDAVGETAIIVSHLDPKREFDGISDLQNEFEHKIYMLQKSYIERFHITTLPIRVDIIGGKGIWIKEYGLETLDSIHEKFTGVTR